jgi:hypothetical protein
VIGDLGRLPRRPRDAVAARRTDCIEEAHAAVAVAPKDGRWDPLWAPLRQAFQDKGLTVHGVWVGREGGSRRPHKPWPGSMWAFPATRQGLVWYRLVADPKGYDPGDCRVLFERSKHKGKTLREVPVAYVDWLLGQDWLDQDSFFGRMLRLYVGRLAPGHLQHLTEEPFDTRGFSPLDAQPGVTVQTISLDEDVPRDCHWRSWPTATVVRERKPGTWALRRPPPQAEAEDEALNQTWPASGGQRLLWREGLGLEAMPVLYARKARGRVYWAVIDGQPVVKGGSDDGLRVVAWDRCLEAIDGVASAPDLNELDRRHRRADGLVDSVAMSEGLDPDTNPLRDELDGAYLQRRDQLERHEEPLSDFKAACVSDGDDEGPAAGRGRPRSLGSKVVQKLAADMQAARVVEAVRRMRGCRTLDDLADVALWIRCNRDLFTEDALARLRGWHARFKAEIVTAHLDELNAKYGGQQALAAGV